MRLFKLGTNVLYFYADTVAERTRKGCGNLLDNIVEIVDWICCILIQELMCCQTSNQWENITVKDQCVVN